MFVDRRVPVELGLEWNVALVHIMKMGKKSLCSGLVASDEFHVVVLELDGVQKQQRFKSPFCKVYRPGGLIR